ncbi:MAG: DUF3108 domain-containing protein [Terriglobia bacterium]|jgi:hypothetical protein
MQTPPSRLVSAFLLVLLLITLAAGMPQNPREPFAPGETLTYDVMWTVFRAGTVTATLQTGGEGKPDAYEATATARSEGFVSLLFNVDNVFRAISSQQTLCSQSIVKKVSEGHRRKDTQIAFDYARKLALLDERDLNQPEAPPKHAEFDIPPCVEDVVTAFYYLRRQHLEVGHNIELPVNDGSKTQRVIVEVQAREKVPTPMGTFDALRVEPKVFNGLLKRKGRMLIWFSADERELPLRIKAMMSVGTLTGTLRSATYAKQNTPPAKH